MSDFRHVMLRFDPDDGSAEIQGRVHVRGMRVIHESLDATGHNVYVVRYPGHSYRSLAGSGRAAAHFEVLVDDYGFGHLDRDRREEDAPWISCIPVCSFPVMAGTKLA